MKSRIAIFVFFLFLIIGCKNDPCMKGKGDTVTVKRSLSATINSISLFDNIQTEIFIDSGNYVEIIGGENLVDFLKTETSGSELTIKNENKCSFLRGFDQDILIRIHIPTFNTLLYDGSRDLIMKDTLKVNTFNLESNEGAGDLRLLIKAKESVSITTYDASSKISLYGSGPALYINNSGTGYIEAANYYCTESNTENKSTGDCTVNVSNSLTCHLNGIGDILYYGNPTVTIVENSGKGRVMSIK